MFVASAGTFNERSRDSASPRSCAIYRDYDIYNNDDLLLTNIAKFVTASFCSAVRQSIKIEQTETSSLPFTSTVPACGEDKENFTKPLTTHSALSTNSVIVHEHFVGPSLSKGF